MGHKEELIAKLADNEINVTLLIKVLSGYLGLGLGVSVLLREITRSDQDGFYKVTVEYAGGYKMTFAVDLNSQECFLIEHPGHTESGGRAYQDAYSVVDFSNPDKDVITLTDIDGNTTTITSTEIEVALQESGYRSPHSPVNSIRDLDTGKPYMLTSGSYLEPSPNGLIRSTVLLVTKNNGAVQLVDLMPLIRDESIFEIRAILSYPGLVTAYNESETIDEYYYVNVRNGQVELVKTNIMAHHRSLEEQGINEIVREIQTANDGIVLVVTEQSPLNLDGPYTFEYMIGEYQIVDGKMQLLGERPIEIDGRLSSNAAFDPETATYYFQTENGVMWANMSDQGLVMELDAGESLGQLFERNGMVFGPISIWNLGEHKTLVKVIVDHEPICSVPTDGNITPVYSVQYHEGHSEFPFLLFSLSLLFILSSVVSFMRGSSDKTPA